MLVYWYSDGSDDAVLMQYWCQARINNGRVLCDVVVQQGCSGNIAHQSGSIAAPAGASQNTHTTEREKGMVLCEF